jgi:hypothetical protein
MLKQQKKMALHVGKLIKDSRLNHPKHYSQSELSHLLGYLNGQFISNIERQICTLPTKMIPKVCTILNIDVEVMKEAFIKDYILELNAEIDRITGVASMVTQPITGQVEEQVHG